MLGMAVMSCQKSNDSLVTVAPPVNAVALRFVGTDSIDIANNLNANPPSLIIADSFAVTMDPIGNFSYLQVQIQNDSGNVLYQESYS